MPEVAEKPQVKKAPKISEKKVANALVLEQNLVKCNNSLRAMSRITSSPLPPHKVKKYNQLQADRLVAQMNARSALNAALQKMNQAELGAFYRRLNP